MAKATIETRHHEDGAVSHHIELENGDKHMILIQAGHPLTREFIAHGSKTRIQSVLASSKDAAEAGEKLAKLEKSFDEGKWSMIDRSGEGKFTPLTRALAKVSGKPLADASAYIKSLSRADQAKLRAHPDIMTAIAQIEAEERAEVGEGVLGGFLTSEASSATGTEG